MTVDLWAAFFPPNPIIRAMLLLMLALFVLGLVLAVGALINLLAERKAAQHLLNRKILLLDRITLPLMLGTAANRLPGQLLMAMVQQKGMASARPSDALDPVLDSVNRISSAARTMPNLLLLFGLISTVVGLAFTLQSLGPQIQDAINSGEPTAVAGKLGETLREMGGAFAGTLWGVSTAFLLQVLNAAAGVQADKLSGELDQVVLRFAPDVYPAGTEEQLASLTKVLQHSEQFLAVTQQKISETSEQFAAVLGDAGKVIQESLKTLNTSSIQISKALQQASGDVRQSSERLTKAVDAIKNHQEDFRNIYTSFNEMFERSMKELKLHSESQLGEIRHLQKDFGQMGGQIVQEIFKTSEKLGGLSQGLGKLNDSFLAGTQDVNLSLKAGFQRLDTDLGKTLGSYTTEVNAVSTQLALFSSSFTELDQHVQANEGATRLLERTLRAKDDAERTRIKDLMNAEQTLIAATARMATGLEQLQPLLTALQQQMVGTLTDLGDKQAATLAGLLAGMNEQSSSVQQNFEAVSQGLAQYISHQTGEQQGLTQTLHKQGTETNLLLSGLLDQLSSQSEQWTEQGQQREQWQATVNQSQDAATHLTRLLQALPEQLRVAELAHSQLALIASLERLIDSESSGPEPIDQLSLETQPV